MKLYYLGPKGTYSELCAKKVLAFLINKQDKFKNLELTPISTINKVIELTENNENSIAVLPIENFIEGIVRQTVDNILKSNLKIQLQTELNIDHCLVSKGTKNEIKHIISHPQALAQCQNYILENFNEKIDLINSTSTASAVNEISNKDNSYAAICALNFAKSENLNIIEENIGDIKENVTRFVVLSKNELFESKKTRTSIVFNTKNKPGELLKILEIFNRYNLNLIYLESRPSKRVFGEYNFFSDIDKGYDEIKNALKEVEKECNYYKFLGSYSEI